ncbi:ABC transporter, partial [Pseudomonas sp. HMWF031]
MSSTTLSESHSRQGSRQELSVSISGLSHWYGKGATRR